MIICSLDDSLDLGPTYATFFSDSFLDFQQLKKVLEISIDYIQPMLTNDIDKDALVVNGDVTYGHEMSPIEILRKRDKILYLKLIFSCN